MTRVHRNFLEAYGKFKSYAVAENGSKKTGNFKMININLNVPQAIATGSSIVIIPTVRKFT